MRCRGRRTRSRQSTSRPIASRTPRGSPLEGRPSSNVVKRVMAFLLFRFCCKEGFLSQEKRHSSALNLLLPSTTSWVSTPGVSPCVRLRRACVCIGETENLLSGREGEVRFSFIHVLWILFFHEKVSSRFRFPKGEKEKSKSALRRNRRERPTTVYRRSIFPRCCIFHTNASSSPGEKVRRPFPSNIPPDPSADLTLITAPTLAADCCMSFCPFFCLKL